MLQSFPCIIQTNNLLLYTFDVRMRSTIGVSAVKSLGKFRQNVWYQFKSRYSSLSNFQGKGMHTTYWLTHKDEDDSYE